MEYQTGQVYRLSQAGNYALVVVLEVKDNNIIFGGLSPIITQACSWDIIVAPATVSPIGASFIVEIWNRITVPANSTKISECLGCLSPKYSTAVMELYIEWLAKGQGDKNAFAPFIGTPLNHPDFRGEFQQEELTRLNQLA